MTDLLGGGQGTEAETCLWELYIGLICLQIYIKLECECQRQFLKVWGFDFQKFGIQNSKESLKKWSSKRVVLL